MAKLKLILIFNIPSMQMKIREILILKSKMFTRERGAKHPKISLIFCKALCLCSLSTYRKCQGMREV